VIDERYPEDDNFIRANMKINGYYIKKGENGNAVMYYLNQIDFGGSLPSWIVNWISTFLAPNVANKFLKESIEFQTWKSKDEKS
jgi:hypothetical protein